MSNKPHKHAELIKAWADGAQIQFRSDVGEWVDVVRPPWKWGAAVYRIKPMINIHQVASTYAANMQFVMHELRSGLNATSLERALQRVNEITSEASEKLAEYNSK